MVFYKISEFAKIVGKSSRTIREWDRLGILKPHHKGQGGYRYYSEEQIKEALMVGDDVFKEKLKNVVYCAGKSAKDVGEKMKDIITFIDFECSNLEIIRDVNEFKNLSVLISDIIDKKVGMLILHDKSELSKDSIVLLEEVCRRFDCDIKYMF